MKTSFYRCNTCGNMVGQIKNGGGQLVCCGSPMEKLEANTTEASHEKHIPVVSREDGKVIVSVGSLLHPMTAEHYIEWIAYVTDGATERIALSPGGEPKAAFCDKGTGEVYAYCNLHGLWKADAK